MSVKMKQGLNRTVICHTVNLGKKEALDNAKLLGNNIKFWSQKPL